MSENLRRFLEIFGSAEGTRCRVLLMRDGRVLVNDAARGIRSTRARLAVTARTSGAVKITENGVTRTVSPDDPLFRRAASVLERAYRRHIAKELRRIERSETFRKLLVFCVLTALQGKNARPASRAPKTVFEKLEVCFDVLARSFRTYLTTVFIPAVAELQRLPGLEHVPLGTFLFKREDIAATLALFRMAASGRWAHVLEQLPPVELLIGISTPFGVLRTAADLFRCPARTVSETFTVVLRILYAYELLEAVRAQLPELSSRLRELLPEIADKRLCAPEGTDS